jgi:hypothetical protein
MVNLRRLADRAKKIVDRRGGTDALKEDATELKGIATGEGTLKDKAKTAADAVKDPGAPGEEQTKQQPDARGAEEKKQAE